VGESIRLYGDDGELDATFSGRTDRVGDALCQAISQEERLLTDVLLTQRSCVEWDDRCLGDFCLEDRKPDIVAVAGVCVPFGVVDHQRGVDLDALKAITLCGRRVWKFEAEEQLTATRVGLCGVDTVSCGQDDSLCDECTCTKGVSLDDERAYGRVARVKGTTNDRLCQFGERVVVRGFAVTGQTQNERQSYPPDREPPHLVCVACCVLFLQELLLLSLVKYFCDGTIMAIYSSVPRSIVERFVWAAKNDFKKQYVVEMLKFFTLGLCVPLHVGEVGRVLAAFFCKK